MKFPGNLPILLLAAATLTGAAAAQEKEKNEARPLLRLEAGGPTSNVTAVAFSPDGKLLYVAGFDKVVRVWKWDEPAKTFQLDESISYRVPIGPGINGAINAIAVSADGQYLAVGGYGVVAEGMKFTEAGRLIPTKGGLTASMRNDLGQISVWNTRDRSVKVLRGHSGPVLSLSFATNKEEPLLLSAAEGWDFGAAQVIGEAKVWNVEKEKEVATRDMPPLTFARRPGLALINERNMGDPVAFLAWENGQLFRWALSAKPQVIEAPKYNASLDAGASVGGPWKILGTGILSGRAGLNEWDLSGQPSPFEARLAAPPAGESDLPLVARYLPKRSHAVAVVRRYRDSASHSDSILVASILQERLGAVTATIPLAQKNNILPMMAVSERHVAIGGFTDHGVRVFNVDELKAGNAAPVVLRSAGTTMRTVTFVKQGDNSGVSLGENAAADRVFDITNSKLIAGAAGWASDTAVPGDLALGVIGGKWTLTKGGKALSSGDVKEGAITASAVSPAIGVEVPLVAIASYIPQKGATLLDLVNGATGETLRRFAGHTAPIRSLSFRADGKLLASVAEDQTTIVWSLTDLGEVLGKHGSLGDLAAEKLIVLDTDDVKGIEVNDVIAGIYNKAGELVPLKTSSDFYERIWMRKPGSTAKLQVTRAKKNVNVEVKVRQGVDVRKPLFTLFFPRDAAGKIGSDWIGWNAIGPYDSSRRAVEQYLGWHFNTGKPDRPTSFAFIDEYRKEYYRPGVLKEMADRGDLPPPPKPPAPKPVLLVPGVAEDGVLLTKVSGGFLVRKKKFDLHVTIPGYDPLPGDELTWQLDGPAQPFAAAEGNHWSASVAFPDGGVRNWSIVVRMKRAPEGWPVQEFRTDVGLRRVFAAPKIELEMPKTTDAIKTDKPEFSIKYRVVPGDPEVGFEVFDSQHANGKLVGKLGNSKAKAGKTIDAQATYTLEPGLNLIRLLAVNKVAFSRVREEDETATATLEVTYVEKKSPPAISVKTLLEPNAAPQPANGNLRVASGRVKLVGKIESESAITSAEWSLGEQRTPIEIAKTGDFTIDVELKPGVNNLRIVAKNAKGLETADTQVIKYWLTMPAIVVTSPEEGFVTAEKTIPVEVRWSPGAARPITIEAYASSGNNVLVRRVVTPDLSDGRATFPQIPVEPGNNAIRIRMINPLVGADQVAEIHGRRIQPPTIAALTATPIEKSPFVDVIAEASSPLPPAAPLVEVKVNGAAARPASVAIEEIGKDLWRITAKQTPLPAVKGQETKCDIALSLTTADGTVTAKLKDPVVVNLPLPPAPAVFLIEPGLRESTIPDPVAKLRFQVTSETPLTRVDVLRGEKVVKSWPAPKAAAEGIYELFLPEVALEFGLNPLSIVAVNEGGVATSPLTINVPPQPVRLELDAVQIAPNGLKIKASADGGFAPLPAGRLLLHGSVQWNPYDDAKIDKAKAVRVYVNGYQQLPAELKAVAGKSRTKTFSIPVVLGHSDNLIEVELPELKQDAANRRRFSLACLTPVRGQQLHILVIAPQEKDEAGLADHLARGIKAEHVSGNVYKTPVYEAVRIHVLGKHVQLLEISSRLDRIAESLRERARAGNPNDLVLIYFQGKETSGTNGPVLWTSETAPWLQLSLGDLSRNYLSRFSGGQLLILDTISPTGDIDLGGMRFAAMRRPDPRPLAQRPRLSAELEKEMPRVVWLDQLNTVLSSHMRPAFQSYLPEALRNKIQLNPNP